MKSNGLSMLSRRRSNFPMSFLIYQLSRNPNGTYKGWVMTSDCHKNFWGLDGNKVILITIVVHFIHVSFLSGRYSRLQYRVRLHGCYRLISCPHEVWRERLELLLIESLLYEFTLWPLTKTLSTFGNLKNNQSQIKRVRFRDLKSGIMNRTQWPFANFTMHDSSSLRMRDPLPLSSKASFELPWELQPSVSSA